VAPFVLLALALAAVALGAAAVAVRQLLLAGRKLRAAAQGAVERFSPLVEELQAEVAVTSTEAEALQERLTVWQSARRRGPNVHRGVDGRLPADPPLALQ
jgi:hypothetical protein